MFCTCSRIWSITALSSRPARVISGIARLGAQRVGLAVELLGEEIEPPAGRLARGEQLARAGDMGAEPLQFLLDVRPRRQHGRLLVKAAFVEAGTRLQQARRPAP